MSEKSLTLEKELQIKERAKELLESKKLKKVVPVVVFGENNDEKDYYVAYLTEPTLPQFSKFLSASKSSSGEAVAMRALAKDCFVEGDKELVDDDSLFIFGLMGQLSEIITSRQSAVVNL